MYTLGINAAFHDPAAALVQDGVILAAAEEERFTHIKHGKRPLPFTTWELPFHAIDYCLAHAGITMAHLEHVAYSFDPALLLGADQHAPTIALPLEPHRQMTPSGWYSSWDPLFLSSIVNAPRQLVDGVPHHLQQRFRGVKAGQEPYRWHWVPHHLAHAASAFLCSPFDHAAIMTLDGRGEHATTSYAMGQGNTIESISHVQMPSSLGLLYEQVTEYLGFLRSSDEYKVMALASYGTPRFASYFRGLIQIGDQGRYTIAPANLEEAFGPARLRGGEVNQDHFDIAHSLQLVLEESVLQICDWLKRATSAKNLCLAGGVALNCVMNGKILNSKLFDQVWIQPAAGDAGTALGAACWVDVVQRKETVRHPLMEHAFLGPEFSDESIEDFLKWSKLRYRKMADTAEETAEILARGKVIGWFQGRMEFGPRALGARSILASPIPETMQARLNEIKDREDFRPVAPVVLEEEAARWFENVRTSPFMLLVFPVSSERTHQIPAVRHVDGSARVQTVRADQHPLLHNLLRAFEKRTGVPILVNTSFNTRGEPIVCTPRDAIESFWTSPLDALVIGSFLLEK